jgi:AraC-like DNA-binding protein
MAMTEQLSDAAQLVRPTIPAAYLADIARRCRAPGAIRGALAAAGLAPRSLASPRLRVSIAQFERFHTALVRARDDELMGCFARPVPRGGYATVVQLMCGAPDVAAALAAATRFYRLFDRHAYLSLTVTARTATLALAPREPAQARSVFFVHSMLLSAWRTAAWLAGRAIPLVELRLPPALRGLAREAAFLFGREPVFATGAPRLGFAAEHAAAPIVRRPDEADAFARASLRAILLAPPRPSLQAALRAVLAAAVPFATLDVADAAKRLGMSRATLARRLARDGTAFQEVKDELRRDRAIALLAETRLNSAEIAERLGFSEASAFQRAFRDWTGAAPGAVRASRR